MQDDGSPRTAAARYELGGLIARGGMGEVLAATDTQFGRDVALKRMRQKEPDKRALERFFREATIQGRLDHPAIVPVYDLGLDGEGRPFFTMKRIAGTSLEARIAGGHPRQQLLRAFVDVCHAIELAHSRRILHRDLKPANIVLGEYGEVYVLDWGVAKTLGVTEEEPIGLIEPPEDPVTLEGAIVGTPGYLPPEQLRAAKDVDERADVYALGCVLFEILAGEPYHPKKRDHALRSTLAPPDARPSVRAPGREVPPELDALCVAATTVDREHRLAGVRELGAAVQRYLDGDRDLAMREELARDHLDRARAAFAGGPARDRDTSVAVHDRDGSAAMHGRDSAAARAVAMREAGRALALDPKLVGAAELVTRLMLEPPRELPPAVEKMIADDNMETLRRQSRAGARGFLGYLGFAPAIAASGGDRMEYVVALIALIALNCTLLLAPPGFRHIRIRAWAVAIGNAALIALLARMASPILIAPGVAAVVTMSLAFSPTYKRLGPALAMAAGMAAAVLVPWGLELAGVLSPTMSVTADRIVIETVMHLRDPLAEQGLLAIYVVGLILGAAGLAFANRRTERAMRSRLHLQAWQLRQLAPTA